MHALEVKNLRKTYQSKVGKDGVSRTVEALKGVSLSIEPGEIFGLLGPNGAGKTTLINTITTLETPTSGDVEVFGQSVVHNSKVTKRLIGVVHQEVINTGFFDLVEILEFMSGFHGLRKNDDRINYVLDRLGLTQHKNKKVKQLSGGMKRRLMIAKALVHSPKLLLLDEPTAGVDVELRESLWRFVEELKASGVTILLTTHYLEEAEKLCDRIGIINLGELIFCGTPKDVIAKYATKKLSIKLRSGESKSFVDQASIPICDIIAKHNISFSDVADIQVVDGKLEEAFTRVVSVGVSK